MEGLVILQNDNVVTNSLLVAEKFGKRHDDVLKAIRKMECSDKFRARNFADSSYKSAQNKDLPMVVMTKDGFSILVMGFTGKQAMQFKEDFINAFALMESILKQKQKDPLKGYTQRILSKPVKNKPLGYWSVFEMSHSIMLDVEMHIGTKDEFDLIDGSIGRKWAAYRKTTAFGKEDDLPFGSGFEPKKCTHSFKDVRGDRQVYCYHNRELVTFLGWLDGEYRSIHMPEYLERKYAENQSILAAVRSIFPKAVNPAA